MKLIYIAGPYTAKTYSDIEDNIRKAEKLAADLWRKGYAVICPHKNTAHMEHISGINYDTFMDGYLEILKRCDYIFMRKGWKKSKGAVKEYNLAKKRGITIKYQ